MTAIDIRTPEGQDLENLTMGISQDPFKLLGAHISEQGGQRQVVLRAFFPKALKVEVLDFFDRPATLDRVDPRGLFELRRPFEGGVDPYRLRVRFDRENESVFYDSYSFSPVLGEDDLYLFNQGNNYRIYDHLGAHPMTHQGVRGVLFAVWAPSARRVSVVGDFNQWDGRRLMMRTRGSSGVWEIFIPHVRDEAIYKYEIQTKSGDVLFKADPYAFLMEQRPRTASIIYDLEGFEWTDRKWMEERTEADPLSQPMSIYEVHLGSWRREEDQSWLTYERAADELIEYALDMGFTHLELLPVAEHPFDGSWGYQVTGFFAASSRFGRPHDLMDFINRCHNRGLGVILDWVPAHFPKDAHGLEYFDGTHLYEHSDPQQGFHQDWGTLIFNYGRHEVKNFLVANALFWLDKYHIDGLRVDAVASMLYLDYSREKGQWTPNKYGGRENLEAIEFIKNFNSKIYEDHRGVVTIAEESTAWPGVCRPVHLGGLGFMFKWNMGWMHDMLEFMQKDPVHRKYHMNNLTFALLYAFNENFILPLSHDEVVHGKKSLLEKMPGDDWQKFANHRLLLGYMFGEPGKKMLFMGSEFGQRWEWNHDDQLQWHLLENGFNQGLQKFVRDLNQLYQDQPALYEYDFSARGFEWIDFTDVEASAVSFIRRAKNPDDLLVLIFNFTPTPQYNYQIGVPRPGVYQELINSDSEYYGGSNLGLGGGITAQPQPVHGYQNSIELTLPPLSMLVLKPAMDE